MTFKVANCDHKKIDTNPMGKLIDYIAQQTEGEPFGSFKYGYDNDPQLRFPYEGETQPITPKQYAESQKIPPAPRYQAP